MFRKIKGWYEGRYTPHENSHNSPLYFVGGYNKRHWTAITTRWLVEFYLREWKWSWGAVFAVTGLYIGYKKLGS